ncbi:condensin complex subunit [Striga asiatica]|uniref:Condensin complex subunit n=1 Tax=Striga asiatica TaxID=4170 RepID=A0A5A7QPH5_STRAF|nr:condensin complex subunit [Striga asiatica]
MPVNSWKQFWFSLEHHYFTVSLWHSCVNKEAGLITLLLLLIVALVASAVSADEGKAFELGCPEGFCRCLGLFGLFEKKPSEVIVKQLRLSFIKAPPMVAIISAKALLDLGIWHSLDEMDSAMNCNLSSQLRNHTTSLAPIDFCNESEDSDIELLDLLFVGLGHDWGDFGEMEDNQSIQGVLGEGLAKILLLSNKFSGSHVSTHYLVLAKLVSLYFSSENDELQRLKQCPSVFFEHYPSLSANHKKCISKAFMPFIRSLWPGIHGNASGSSLMVSNMRKRAAQASRFMLQMMQAPLIVRESTKADNIEGEDLVPSTDFENGEEGLAICIAVEEAAKFMRGILNQVIVSVAAEKDLTKELRRMAERLQAIDQNPEVKISPDMNPTYHAIQTEFDYGILIRKFRHYLKSDLLVWAKFSVTNLQILICKSDHYIRGYDYFKSDADNDWDFAPNDDADNFAAHFLGKPSGQHGQVQPFTYADILQMYKLVSKVVHERLSHLFPDLNSKYQDNHSVAEKLKHHPKFLVGQSFAHSLAHKIVHLEHVSICKRWNLSMLTTRLTKKMSCKVVRILIRGKIPIIVSITLEVVITSDNPIIKLHLYRVIHGIHAGRAILKEIVYAVDNLGNPLMEPVAIWLAGDGLQQDKEFLIARIVSKR